MTRVLLIDDDDLVRYALKVAMEASGLEVVEAADGRMEPIAGTMGEIDIIVTDILMPEVDGLELLRHLDPSIRTTPVIAITAGGRMRNLNYLDIASQLGADAVFAKPVDERDLIAKIEELAASR